MARTNPSSVPSGSISRLPEGTTRLLTTRRLSTAGTKAAGAFSHLSQNGSVRWHLHPHHHPNSYNVLHFTLHVPTNKSVGARNDLATMNQNIIKLLLLIPIKHFLSESKSSLLVQTPDLRRLVFRRSEWLQMASMVWSFQGIAPSVMHLQATSRNKFST